MAKVIGWIWKMVFTFVFAYVIIYLVEDGLCVIMQVCLPLKIVNLFMEVFT